MIHQLPRSSADSWPYPNIGKIEYTTILTPVKFYFSFYKNGGIIGKNTQFLSVFVTLSDILNLFSDKFSTKIDRGK